MKKKKKKRKKEKEEMAWVWQRKNKWLWVWQRKKKWRWVIWNDVGAIWVTLSAAHEFPFSRWQPSPPDFARFRLILRLGFARFLIGFIVIFDWVVEVADCRFFFFFFVDFVRSLLVQLIGVWSLGRRGDLEFEFCFSWVWEKEKRNGWRCP